MKLRLFPGALGVVAAAVLGLPAAHAQNVPQDGVQLGGPIGIYLNPSFSRISNSQVDNGTFTFLGANTTSRWFGGPAFGVYYDFYRMGHFTLGMDVRDTIQHANNAAINTFGVAPRVVWRGGDRLRPYAEVSIGAVSTRPEKSTVRLTRFRVDVLVGADYQLAKHVDLRVVEVGYGTLGGVSTGSFGNNGNPLKNFTALDLSSGLVFRFGK